MPPGKSLWSCTSRRRDTHTHTHAHTHTRAHTHAHLHPSVPHTQRTTSHATAGGPPVTHLGFLSLFHPRLVRTSQSCYIFHNLTSHSHSHTFTPQDFGDFF